MSQQLRWRLSRSGHSDAHWATETCRRGRTAVATVTLHTVARKGGDNARRCDQANAVVALVSDDDGASRGHCDALRVPETRRFRLAAVAAVGGNAIACNSADDARRKNLTDAVVVSIGKDYGICQARSL